MNAAVIIETHNIEAEQSLLGALLINNEAMQRVESLVEPEHFFEPLHQQIFYAVQMLIRLGRMANPVTLAPFLPGSASVGNMTLRQYIAALCSSATTVVNAPDYARVIRDYADRRAIANILAESVPGSADDPDLKASEAIDRLSVLVSQRQKKDDGSVSMRAAVTMAIDATAKAYASDGIVLGLSYGLNSLDAKTSGAQEEDLVIVAGRPSMGKTALAVSMARNFARAGYPGLFFSLEMSSVQLMHRMLADHLYETQSKIAYNQMRSGDFKESSFTGMRDAALEMVEWPIQIEPEAGMSVAKIASRARQWKRKHGLRWIIIDYLQLLQASDRYAGSRVNEISEITRSLKALAKELAVPVIALSQLSRDVERREDKRPNLSDLRESGSIEQDADAVMFVYRESYYLQNREPKPGTPEHELWQNAMSAAWNRVDVIIGKQRMGPVGTVPLFCDIGFNAFRDLHQDHSFLPTSDKILL